MRICVVSYHASPMARVGAGKSGGMSIVIRSLYGYLARFAEIDIFTQGSRGIIEPGPRMRLIHIAEHDPQRFAAAIAGHHHRRQYDLMHTHYWSSGVVGLYARRGLRIPWLHTLHTVEVLKTMRRDKTRIEIEEEIMRACDLVVSPTRQEAAAISARYPEVRVITIPHGVDTRRFTPTRNGHHNILFVGRIEPIKGIHFLIDALKILKLDVGLTLVGGSSKGAANLEGIRTYAAGLPVEFAGQVEHDRLAGYYSRAAMLAVPSHYESFGLVGLEAMASARPVVGFSHTGLQETVGRDAGILVKMGAGDLARAIQTLLADHGLRYRLGRRGWQKARAFDWSRIAHIYQRTYERIIEEEE
ncbi:glycosyltransferase [candidate division WOR-3 bacterium]|nr:glycosyltransferase [candidate division WOR-3 bacterium]